MVEGGFGFLTLWLGVASVPCSGVWWGLGYLVKAATEFLEQVSCFNVWTLA